MWLLELFARANLKRVTIVTLGAGVAILLAYVHQQNVALDQARLVYLHPRSVSHTVRRTEKGPVRIVTRIVERPSGEKETTIEETRGAESETETTSSETVPVPLAVAMAPPRTDRWLVGGDLRNWDPNRLTAYTAYAGYSFRNRVDVLAGVGRPTDRIEGHLLVVIRF